jgi:hypothetical protein
MSETIVFTGVVLPPTESAHGNLDHACQEFTREEAHELVQHMANLPLLYDHADGDDGNPVLQVGKVMRAWVDEDGGVRVMAALNENSDIGRRVRHQVLNRSLPELSLSHKYELYHTGEKLVLTKQPLEVFQGRWGYIVCVHRDK